MGGIKVNENIDLTKILEGCPKGAEFYSTLFGEVAFVKISDGRIIVDCTRIKHQVMFNTAGKHVMNEMRYSDDLGNHFHSVECLLFPSKEQRDWLKFERFWDKPKIEKFDVNTLQPFDKILVRNSNREDWNIEHYSYKRKEDRYIRGLAFSWKYVIPYNDETKHLVGTTDDCPEYYKWWKE